MRYAIACLLERVSLKKLTVGAIVIIIAAFAVIQLVPYGRDHSNPPTISEPAWDSPQTRALVVRSCFACHSNQASYPWYSNVAPMSWIVERDIGRARHAINFSQWQGLEGPGTGFIEIVRSRAMPPCDYLWLHPSSELPTEEVQALAQGLEATFGIPVSDAPVAENGRGILRCAKEQVLYEVVPKRLRKRELGLAFVGLLFVGGAALAAAYGIYRRRS